MGKYSLDHIVFLSPSASAAKEFVIRKTGVQPVYGGEHPDIGTCNYLISLENDQYLEVLVPHDDVDYSKQSNNILSACFELDAPKPSMFCVRVEDFAHLLNVLRRFDIEADGPSVWQRKKPEGGLLKWFLVTCFGNRFGNAFPFFIQWDDCEHPAASSPKGCTLDALTVHHPKHEELAEIYDALELGVKVKYADTYRLSVTLATPTGEAVF